MKEWSDMNRDEKYRATHKEQRNAYDRAYRKARRAKKGLFQRLLNKIRRTR